MKIETQRLIIRDFINEDWISVHKYASNHEVTKFTLWGPNSEGDTKSYIEQQINKQQSTKRIDYEFGVLLRESNLLVGGCGIYLKDNNAEIGFCFNPE